MDERFDFGPEVRNQSGGVAVAAGPNTAQPVFVILLGPPFFTHLMGVVESHRPLRFINCRRSTSSADPAALDRNDLGTGAQFVQVVGPRLQHLAALLEELGPVVGSA